MVGRRVVRVCGVVVLASALSLLSPFGAVLGDPAADAAVDGAEIDPEDRVSPAVLPALDARGDRSEPSPDPRLNESKPSDPPKRVEAPKLDPKRPPVPDMAKVDQERSSAAQLVWESSPGVFTAAASSLPKWFKAADGRWAEIDVSVAPVEGVAGVVSTRAGPWSATFAPVGPGVGGVSVVAADGDVLSWRPSAMTATVAPKVSEDGLMVTYRGVWPGVDLRYRLSTVGIAEEMVLTSPEAQGVFAFDVDQRLVRDGVAEAEAAKLDKLPDVQRRISRFSIEGVDGIELGAPKMLTGDGVPLSDAPVVSLAGDAGKGSVWTVGVDDAWLKSQPVDAFPLVLDPGRPVHHLRGRRVEVAGHA